MSQKEKLLGAIGDYCIDNNILVDDIPPFVDQVLHEVIPFKNKKASKVNKEYNFNYDKEVKEDKKTIDLLP